MASQVQSKSVLSDALAPVEDLIPAGAALTDEVTWDTDHPFQVPPELGKAIDSQHLKSAEQQSDSDWPVSVYPDLVAGQQGANSCVDPASAQHPVEPAEIVTAPVEQADTTPTLPFTPVNSEQVDRAPTLPFTPVNSEQVDTTPFTPVNSEQVDTTPFTPVNSEQVDTTPTLPFTPVNSEQVDKTPPLPFTPVNSLLREDHVAALQHTAAPAVVDTGQPLPAAARTAGDEGISFSPRTKALSVNGHVTLPQDNPASRADRGSGSSEQSGGMARASAQSRHSSAAAPPSPDVSPRRGPKLVHSISTLPSPFARATTTVVREARHMQRLEDEALLLSNAAAAAVAAFPLPGNESLRSDTLTEDPTASTSTHLPASDSLRYTGQGTQQLAAASLAGPGSDAPEAPASPGPMSSPRSAQELWQGAVRNINTLHLVSRQFRTLRDMRTSLEIPREAIKVVSMLGKGAFAIVEQCVYQPAGGRPQLVAVKRLRPELTKNKEDLRDLVQEVALLRKLHHKHVIEFLGYGYWEFSTSATTRHGSLFIVEELVDGGNLKTLVSHQLRDTRCRHYRAADAVRWLKQVASGLSYLHASHPQVIHRDLKLENILLKGRDVTCSDAKLGDFGLSAIVRRTSMFSTMQKHLHKHPVRPARARRNSATDMEAVWADAAARRNSMMPGQAAQAAADARGLSGGKRAGASGSSGKKAKPGPAGLHIGLEVATGYEQLSGRTGTLMYMAPEVYRQEPYSEKADVFSWSIIAYELLHRYMMIRATDGSLEECQAYARRVAYGFRPPINNRMPRELVGLLTRCWDHNPDKRPDMASVAQRLAVLETTLDLEAFDRNLLGAAYTQQLAQELRPQVDAAGLCCCSIS